MHFVLTVLSLARLCLAIYSSTLHRFVVSLGFSSRYIAFDATLIFLAPSHLLLAIPCAHLWPLAVSFDWHSARSFVRVRLESSQIVTWICSLIRISQSCGTR